MFLFDCCCRKIKRERYDELESDTELKQLKVIDPLQELQNAKIQNAVNFFTQIQQSVPESIAFLQQITYKGELHNRIKKFTELFLPNRKITVEDTESFFIRLNGIIIHLQPKHQKLYEHIQNIANHVFLKNNVRLVHQNLVDALTSPEKFLISFKLKLPIQSDLMQSIILRYNKLLSSLKKVSVKIPTSYNLPNVTYKVAFPQGNVLTFFRTKSPIDTLSNKIYSNIFKVYLKHMQITQNHHLDLSLMRLPEEENEARASKLRHELQDFDPTVLFSWAFDFYADYEWRSQNTTYVKEFTNEFIAHFLNNEMGIFRLPPSAAKLQFLEYDLRYIIRAIHEDFFFSEEYFEKKEFEPFICLVVIHLIEYFCEKFNTSVCTTACYRHIDRGMVIMTLLFHYIQIKSNQEKNPEYLKYIETMIFAPALIYYNRTPHEGVMSTLLHTLALFGKPEVIQNIKKRWSYFSNVQLIIP